MCIQAYYAMYIWSLLHVFVSTGTKVASMAKARCRLAVSYIHVGCIGTKKSSHRQHISLCHNSLLFYCWLVVLVIFTKWYISYTCTSVLFIITFLMSLLVCHHGQCVNSSSITWPRLENGIGIPNSREMVGTKSIWEIVSLSFYNIKVQVLAIIFQCIFIMFIGKVRWKVILKFIFWLILIVKKQQPIL